MDNVYAVPGESMQQIGGEAAEGWVQMLTERPTLRHVADGSGFWVIPPEPVPAVVSRFQGREAMRRTERGDGTLFEAAEALLADPSTLAMYRRAWDELQEFRRDSEMLAAIAGLLGLTDLQIDALFILAADIQA